MTTVADAAAEVSNLIPRLEVIYCGKCGMPPEYCQYGPDFETHCDPWLERHHPELHAALAEKRGKTVQKKTNATAAAAQAKVKPADPWTTQQRLMEFYKQYMPEKVEGVPALIEKYAGKEEKLFDALVKKYGPEPNDPYFSDSDESDDDDDDDNDAVQAVLLTDTKKNKRRGASAKKEEGGTSIRVVVAKVSQKKKRHLTIVTGMDTVPDCKLKDVSKSLSKKFAGSSSVKENARGEKEIILQGDHLYDVAEMIVDTFNVPDTCVFLNIDDVIVPLR
jgi:density-regulated protein DRP1